MVFKLNSLLALHGTPPHTPAWQPVENRAVYGTYGARPLAPYTVITRMDWIYIKP